jgi:uncharacterized protein (DUF952 family)
LLIYHLTDAEKWRLAQNLGTYRAISLEKQGFIHCCTQSQIIPIANTFYSDASQLLVLTIDSTQLESTLKWEAPSHPTTNHRVDSLDSQIFPHVYGPINLDAVRELQKNKIPVIHSA